MMLQHEITDLSVKIFMDIFPLVAQKGWRYESLAKVLGDGRTYQNADANFSDDVQPLDVGDNSDDDDDDDDDSSSSAAGSSTARPSGSGSSSRSGGL